jgi:drug/metabolite transporter (DMT)-like permease
LKHLIQAWTKNFTSHQKGIASVLITAVLWSSGGLFIKLVPLGPMQISFFRCSIAAAFFAIVFRKQVFYANGFAIINSIIYGTVLTFFVIATKTTTAANAVFLQATAPVYVLIFEPLINKTKYEVLNIIIISVCIIGMLLFFIGDITPGQQTGNLIALASGAAFAALFLGLRFNKKEFQFSSIFYGNVLVALVCIPYITNLPSLSIDVTGSLIFLGVFQIGAAYAIFAYGIKRVLAVEASILSMIEPVLNPVWVFIGYGEIPSINAIIGGSIIISAIVIKIILSERKNRRQMSVG